MADQADRDNGGGGEGGEDGEEDTGAGGGERGDGPSRNSPRAQAGIIDFPPLISLTRSPSSSACATPRGLR